MNKLKLLRDGTKIWSLNGEFHRVDGPAVEYSSGYKEWWLNDKLHRIDGPAVINHYNEKDYFLNGKYYSNEGEWFQDLTPEQQYNYLWNLDE